MRISLDNFLLVCYFLLTGFKSSLIYNIYGKLTSCISGTLITGASSLNSLSIAQCDSTTSDYCLVASGYDSGSNYTFYSCASSNQCSSKTKTFSGITASILCCSTSLCNKAAALNLVPINVSVFNSSIFVFFILILMYS